jgi:hypothetical protein
MNKEINYKHKKMDARAKGKKAQNEKTRKREGKCLKISMQTNQDMGEKSTEGEASVGGIRPHVDPTRTKI